MQVSVQSFGDAGCQWRDVDGECAGGERRELGSVAPLRIKYDADLLRLEDIAPGDIFSQGGGGATSTKDIRNDAGEASITISRLPGAAGVCGVRGRWRC